MEKYLTLKVERKNRWVHIALNRPEVKNALSEEMASELLNVLTETKNDDDTRGLTLRGLNGAFCAGADLKDFKNNFVLKTPNFEEVKNMNINAGILFRELAQIPKIVVALVDGPAYAGGLGMVCCADIVIITRAAKFSLSETAIGLTPAQISPYLIKRLGIKTASKLMLTGMAFGAKEAFHIGLADELVETEKELDEYKNKIILDTKKVAPRATAATKEIISFSRDATLKDLSAFAANKFAECMLGEEAKEGLLAFSEKRKPYWYGNTDD